MELRNEKLSLFFEQIKTVTFWQRIFSWNTLRGLSYEAYEEFRSLVGSFDRISDDLDKHSNTISILEKDNEHLNSNIDSKDKTMNEQVREIALLKQRVEQLLRVEQENIAFKQNESNRQREHENKVSILTREIERVEGERNKEIKEHQKAEIERIQSMEETWGKHQESVKNAIKMICQKHTIEYVDNVPFKGTPDNTIKIADEYIVFDAKSPRSDDLRNFPTYIKDQTDSVKKYIKEDNVRKEIFLVIPSNAVHVIQQFSFNMADYIVHIVTRDVLEPLILSLKRIEDYEFVNQLSPEERENICRVIGKFAHVAKRRIQIDHFFAWEFFEIFSRCRADLPRDVLEKVIEFEKSEKLNPPQERRAKQLLTKDLETENEKVQKEAETKAIVFPPSIQQSLREFPLYEDEESGSTEHT